MMKSVDNTLTLEETKLVEHAKEAAHESYAVGIRCIVGADPVPSLQPKLEKYSIDELFPHPPPSESPWR